MVEISVIIPLHNEKHYISKCLDSIFNQSFHDFEVVVIDDGSTDGSGAIVQEYSKVHKNLIYIAQVNQGAAKARNVGIKRAAGKWITFVDSDDYIDEKYFETLLKFSEQFPTSDVIATSCTAFSSHLLSKQSFFPSDCSFNTHESKEILYHQLMDSSFMQDRKHYSAIGVPWGKLYLKKFIIKNSLFFNEKLRRLEDNLFMMRVIHDSNSFSYVNYCGYYYRVESIENRANTLRSMGYYRNVPPVRYDLLSKYGLFTKPLFRKLYYIEKFDIYFSEISATLMKKQNIKQTISECREKIIEFDKIFYQIDCSALNPRRQFILCLLRHNHLTTLIIILQIKHKLNFLTALKN